MNAASPQPNIVILGTGAIGGVTGAFMTRAGTKVTLVDPWALHVSAMQREGLRVTTPDEEFSAQVDARHINELPALGPIDILLLSLKSFDTEWAVRYVAPYLAPGGVVVSLQNGVNEERIAELIGAERTIGCVVHMAGACTEPGRVHGICGKGWGAFTVGELDGKDTPRAKRIAELLSPAGVTHATTTIWAPLWSKLALNVMTNALSGLSGYATRELWSNRQSVALMARLGGETIRVAEASGITVGEVKPTGAPEPITPGLIKSVYDGDKTAFERFYQLFTAVAEKRVGKSENQASLLQDILKRRHTEVDFLNGYVAARGKRHNIPTPFNQAVVEAMTRLERDRAEPSPARIQDLLALA